MNIISPTHRLRVTRALTLGAAALLLALAGCGDDAAPEPAAEAVTATQAMTPEQGDFSTCEAVITIDDFDDPPASMEFVDGRLRLYQGTESRPDLWVANTAARSMSRIDTSTGEVVGTYRVGRHPSRTAVDLNYDVFVANRSFNRVGSVIKYSADCECGVDPDELCPFRCREWVTDIGGDDDRPRGLAIDAQNNVWAVTHGQSNSGGRTLYRLDNATGAILDEYTISVRGYGLAIDQEGLIWIPSINDRRVICFDPATEEECGSFAIPNCSRPYGIAVDVEGNVWLGNWTCDTLGYIDRASFDAQRDAGIEPEFITPLMRSYTNSLFSHTRGVAVDGNNDIWVAASHTDRVGLFDPDEQRFVFTIDVCDAPIGVAISDEGHLWVMCNGADRAYAYRYNANPPAPLSPWYQRIYNTPVGNAPYSYSDMTGFQLRNFTAPEGTWRQTIDCGEDGCGFDYIEWDAELPTGAEIILRYRTSNDGDTWTDWSDPVTNSPAGVDPTDPTSRYIEVEVTLRANDAGETPELDRIDFWRCPRMLTPREFDLDQRFVVDAMANNYGLSWQFVDASWPESRFEVLDTLGRIRCTVTSTTSTRLGQRYAGDAPHPACVETGLASNVYVERAVRAAWEYLPNTWEYSPPSAYVGYYTNVPDPSAALGDIGVVSTAAESVELRWCAPPNNATAALTGAMVVRATGPSFMPGDPGYTVIADFDVDRGYAGPGACGTYIDNDFGAGLEPETTYHYQLVWRNGDGIVSAPTSLSTSTTAASCCYLGICEGVCADAPTGPGGVCLEPPGYEDPEVSCDGLDNDCDGMIDEGLINACGECGPENIEVCNDEDDDCDGLVDNNPVDGTAWYRDVDGDTWGDPDVSVRACTQPPGYVDRPGDCDDGDAMINPDAPEICDGVDNNCDGRIDEGVGGTTFYRDADGDTWGDEGDAEVACDPPTGYVGRPGDCDDTEATINPDAPEVCDLVDNNCDGEIDEGFLDVTVEIDDVLTLDASGTDVCDNAFEGGACGGSLAATVTITNRGTSVVPSDATLSFFADGTPREALGDAMPLGLSIGVGRSISRTWCFGPTDISGTIDVVARVSGEPIYACRAFEDTMPDIEVDGGPEICDGIDNDCDGRVDESPEACGAVLDCVYIEEDDDYACVGTAVSPASSDEADERDEREDDSAGAGPASSTPAPRSGCATAASAPGAASGVWALLLGLAAVRRRRRARRGVRLY